jgi:hypothetical protein
MTYPMKAMKDSFRPAFRGRHRCPGGRDACGCQGLGRSCVHLSDFSVRARREWTRRLYRAEVSVNPFLCDAETLQLEAAVSDMGVIPNVSQPWRGDGRGDQVWYGPL